MNAKEQGERIRATEVEVENLKEMIPLIFKELKALPDLISKKFLEHESRDNDRRKAENFEVRIKELEGWKIKLVAITSVVAITLAFTKDFVIIAIQKLI